jgi:hypothetical protein
MEVEVEEEDTEVDTVEEDTDGDGVDEVGATAEVMDKVITEVVIIILCTFTMITIIDNLTTYHTFIKKKLKYKNNPIYLYYVYSKVQTNALQ